jgi:maleate isomerase
VSAASATSQPRYPQRDYGSLGCMGVCTPQANPTVEAEFRVLLPERMAMATARLTSTAKEPRQRLVDYIEHLDVFLGSYDTLRPDVIAFACTGSAYLVGRKREQALLATQEARLGCPVISATQAIHASLQALGATRIAVFAPYPEWLLEAGRQYWQALGYDIAAHGRIVTRSADTRTIYELTSSDARAALQALRPENVDAVLLSGTGMPGLPLVLSHEDFTSRPVLSSNWCLADVALAALDLPLEAQAVRARLARAVATA